MKFRFLVGFIVIVCFSCQQNRQSKLIELYGTWTLDSISIPAGRITFNRDKFQQMTFSDNGNFIYSWMNGDAGGEYKGKYFVNENPSRKSKTITLIADLVNSGTDTIRHYMNFDILELDNKRLKISGKTEFLDRQNKTVVYTPISIFRRPV
jgi:hypothetical protein